MELNGQKFMNNEKILNYQWHKSKLKLSEKIQEFFHSKKYEVIQVPNFSNFNIFQGIGK